MKMTRAQAQAFGLSFPQRPRKPRATTDNKASQKLFLAMCKAHGLPAPECEVEFHPTRKWRFDYLFGGWLALEVQGGNFSGGRHARGAAMREEYEKLNEAVIAGYSVIFCLPEQVESGAIFPVIRRALGAASEQS